MIRVVATHESNRIKSVVTDCEKLLQKVVSCSTFCNKICTCCTFYRPMADLLCNKRPTLVIDLSPAKFYPIRSQYLHNLQQPDLLQDGFEWGH